MTEQLENSPAPISSTAPNPNARFIASPDNPAVARCCGAFNRTHEAVLADGKHPVIALGSARDAYCRAMPPLVGPRNIRDFIACVAHGMLTRMIPETIATKLVYAAQVAYNTLPKRSQKPRKHTA